MLLESYLCENSASSVLLHQPTPEALCRMPELDEAASAALDREHHDWVCSIPTQAHVRAVSLGEGPSLALSDANSMAGIFPAKLAKLRGDLTRVEGSLPRSALQETWDADRWRKVGMPSAWK